MRNVFDQYDQPENKLTHALATVLREEPDLLREFIFSAMGRRLGKRMKLRTRANTLPKVTAEVAGEIAL